MANVERPWPESAEQARPEVPTPPEVRAALERLAASRNFNRADRCLRLLRHLTEAALGGRAADLKEYSVALAVFEREPSFDTRTDPIVRLEARRLRLKLSEFYQHEGAADPIRLELPKGGYVPEFRYRTALEPQAAVEERTATHPVPRRRSTSVAIWSAVLFILAAGSYWLAKRSYASKAPRSLAIIPFRDNSSNKRLDYFANGVRDGLTSLLVHNSKLRVTARASAIRISETSDPETAARKLGADAVVSGSVSPSGDKIQLVIAVIDGHTGSYLWSKTYQTSAADLAAVEQSAASSIAQALGVRSTSAPAAAPSNREAAEAYLRACALARNRTSSAQAARLFEQVLRLEPDFAPAYAAAANNYLVAVQNGEMQWADAGVRGRGLADRALELEPMLAEAHSAMALVWQTQWEWEKSLAELRRATTLDPRSPVPHYRIAYTLIILHRFTEAENEIETARMLDPAWMAPHGLLGELYFYEHKDAAALDICRRFKEIDNEHFFDGLRSRIYMSEGKRDAAQAILVTSLNALGQALARAGKGEVAAAYQQLLADQRSGAATAYHVASFCMLGLDDRGKALGWLRKSLEEHDPDLVSVALDPMWDGVRNTPEVQELMKQLHLGSS